MYNLTSKGNQIHIEQLHPRAFCSKAARTVKAVTAVEAPMDPIPDATEAPRPKELDRAPARFAGKNGKVIDLKF